MIRNTSTTSPADVSVFRDLAEERPIAISIGSDYLTGSVAIPPSPIAVVLIANDVGCSRQRSGERDLARALRRSGLATVFVDVLKPCEQVWPDVAALLRQKVELLARRIEAGREWVRRQPQLAALPVVLLGSGGAGPASLLAAAAHPGQLAAVIVRTSRPDLAGMALARIDTLVMPEAREQLADGIVAFIRSRSGLRCAA